MFEVVAYGTTAVGCITLLCIATGLAYFGWAGLVAAAPRMRTRGERRAAIVIAVASFTAAAALVLATAVVVVGVAR